MRYPREMLDAVVRLLTCGGEATAFAVHPDGWFLTCDHSLADSNDIAIMLSHNRHEVYDAEVVLRKPESDVAVLRAREGGPYVSLALARGSNVPFGQHAQLSAHFTLDRISRMMAFSPTGPRSVRPINAVPTLIQVLTVIDDDGERKLLAYHAPPHVETGCSGAPITRLDTQGVVGMHAAQIYQGIGVAVHSAELERCLREARAPRRPWWGRGGKRTPEDVAERAANRFMAEWLCVSHTTIHDLDEVEADESRETLDWLTETGLSQVETASMYVLLAHLYFGADDFEQAFRFGMRALEAEGSTRTAYIMNRIGRKGCRDEEIIAALWQRVMEPSAETSFAHAVTRVSVGGYLLDLLWRRARYEDMITVAEALQPHREIGDREMTVRCLHARALCALGRFEEAIADYDAAWVGRAEGMVGIDFSFYARALGSTSGEEARAVRLGLWGLTWSKAPRGLFEHAAAAAGSLGLSQAQAALQERVAVAQDDDVDISKPSL